MRLVECSLERHAAAILDILNEAIVSSTALYDYAPRSMENMHSWFATKSSGRFPVIGMESAAGELLGFASYGVFRAWPAYKYSVEHSVYVRDTERGKGLGARLMHELIAAARGQGYHTLIGAVDGDNAGSVAFHESLGFARCGTIRQAGFKFGRWLDVAFYQLVLDTPANPQDG